MWPATGDSLVFTVTLNFQGKLAPITFFVETKGLNSFLLTLQLRFSHNVKRTEIQSFVVEQLDEVCMDIQSDDSEDSGDDFEADLDKKV